MRSRYIIVETLAKGGPGNSDLGAFHIGSPVRRSGATCLQVKLADTGKDGRLERFRCAQAVGQNCRPVLVDCNTTGEMFDKFLAGLFVGVGQRLKGVGRGTGGLAYEPSASRNAFRHLAAPEAFVAIILDLRDGFLEFFGPGRFCRSGNFDSLPDGAAGIDPPGRVDLACDITDIIGVVRTAFVCSERAL